MTKKILEQINKGIESIKVGQESIQTNLVNHEKEEWILFGELRNGHKLFADSLSLLKEKHEKISKKTDKHEKYIVYIVGILFLIVLYLWIQR